MSSARRLPVAIALLVALLVLAAILGFLEKQGDTEIAALAPEPMEILPASVPPTSVVEFPVAALRSALTAVCSNDAADSEHKEWTQEEIEADLDALNELELRLSDLSDRLSLSSSAEHLHLAALLEDDPALRVELLDRAISRDPSDPLLIWGAVQMCSESGESVDCPLRDWEQRLIAVDGQNSESWVLVAANRYAAGEYDKALEAMRYASTAAESRAYWTETAEMIERGFAAWSDYAFPERAFLALGLATSKLPRYGDYWTMCKEQSAKNMDWAYACVAYGELVENQGKTVMDVDMAHSIQRLGLEALGETEKAAVVEQRLQAHRQERLDSLEEFNPATERLFFSNPSLFLAYLAAVRSEGEVAARARITLEIERLLEQQPELACQAI
ncbi:MAG: hypothetical protein GY949_01325 [Gammaproteobacteria bacterium]|nr:hypothetical protein [Gammaproteobacteria bacterium]